MSSQSNSHFRYRNESMACTWNLVFRTSVAKVKSAHNKATAEVSILVGEGTVHWQM